MNRITHSLAALLLIAGLAGCSEEETLSGTPGDTRTPITITVTDGGYTPDDAARQRTAGSDIRQNADSRPSTRAVDNGYATTFTAGDQIGLYIVKSDGTYAAENIPLTLTDMGDGTSAWQAPTGTTLYYEGAAAKYFAYYPYQQTLPAVSNTPDAPDTPDTPDAPAEPVKPNASATDASDFFAPPHLGMDTRHRPRHPRRLHRPRPDDGQRHGFQTVRRHLLPRTDHDPRHGTGSD